VPLTKETIFPAGSIHEVIAPNKVVELRESSIVLEHPFEGSTEVPFWVSQGLIQKDHPRTRRSWTVRQTSELRSRC
jgi:hypothetical protein